MTPDPTTLTDPLGPTDLTLDGENPWPGLAPFTEEAHSRFHGRDEEVAELARRVQRKSLTVLFGQSGLGKTSILRAGLVPKLRPAGYCPIYVRVSYAADSPSPTEQVKQAILHATGAAGEWTRSGIAAEGESLWEFLHHRDDRLRTAEGRPIIPLLILDQFEEIFTLAQADEAGKRRAASFLDELADLVENRPPRALEARIDDDDGLAAAFDFDRTDYRVLIALREDYLAFLEPLKAQMPSVAQNRMRLARMTGTQALAAVLGPGGHLLDREVAESIVRFVAGGAELRNAEVEPALLSLICRRLNAVRLAQGRSSINADLLEGSRDTLLADFYERALADQPPGVRRVIEQELLTESGYRESLAEERVQRLFAAAGGGPGTLATLVNRRLLRIEERLDSRRVELTHDVLCGVVKASRAQRQALEEKAAAERQLAEQAVKAEEARRALRRARAIAIGCGALALVALAGAVIGIVGARRAALAEAEAVKVRQLSEVSRVEAERLVSYLLDDLYEELEPVGRIDAVLGLAAQAVDYYQKLPTEAQTADTQRNGALARAQLARTLNIAGRRDEADRLMVEARDAISKLVRDGDTRDNTLATSARIDLLAANIKTSRLEMDAALRLARSGLATLRPLLGRQGPPRSAVTTAARLHQSAGFAQRRDTTLGDAGTDLVESLRLLRSLRAAAPTDPRLATDLARASWLYSEHLVESDDRTQAEAMVREALAAADEVIVRNPAHRPALRAKASALRIAATIQRDRLRFRASRDLSAEAIRVDGSIVSMEPSESRSNLRLGWAWSGTSNEHLGRVGEAKAALDRAVDVGQGEQLDNFGRFNVALYASLAARVGAQHGRLRESAVRLTQGAEHAEQLLRTDRQPYRNFLLRAHLAASRATLRLAQGDAAGVESIIAPLIADAAAMGPGLREYRWVNARPMPDLHLVGAEAALLRGEPIVAERHARGELNWLPQQRDPDTRDLLLQAEARVRLALALVQQGKTAAAAAALQPALDFFSLPDVRASDSMLVRGSHARAVLAQALVTPMRRAELLDQARRLFASIPEATRRRLDIATIGDEIARASAGK